MLVSFMSVGGGLSYGILVSGMVYCVALDGSGEGGRALTQMLAGCFRMEGNWSVYLRR